MEIFPVKTRVMNPPKDDLFEVFQTSLPKLSERDVVTVSSKIVSIGEGRCVPITDDTGQKRRLIEEEADAVFARGDKHPLTIKHHAFISASGIDESNADGHYILLPEDPFRSAKEIYDFLKERDDLKELAVVITDSHSLPFRYGVMCVAIGYWGLEPLIRYRGKEDIFGRKFKFERINVVDSMASIVSLVGGEGSEQTPICVMRGMPQVEFVNKDTREDFLIPPKEDIYYPLIKGFFEKD